MDNNSICISCQNVKLYQEKDVYKISCLKGRKILIPTNGINRNECPDFERHPIPKYYFDPTKPIDYF